MVCSVRVVTRLISDAVMGHQLIWLDDGVAGLVVFRHQSGTSPRLRPDRGLARGGAPGGGLFRIGPAIGSLWPVTGPETKTLWRPRPQKTTFSGIDSARNNR